MGWLFHVEPVCHSIAMATVHAGADVASLPHLAQGYLGGQGLAPGPEHSAASDGGLRHPDLQPGSHTGTPHELR